MERHRSLSNCQCKYMIKVRSVSSKNDETNTGKQEEGDFSLGEALQSVYLLDVVFKYLSYGDLLRALQVNEMWKEIAEKELKRRNHLGWFSCKGKGTAFELKCSKNICHYKPRLCMVFMGGKLTSDTSLCIFDSFEQRCVSAEECIDTAITGYPIRDLIIIGSEDVSAHLNVLEKPEQNDDTWSLFEGITLPNIPRTKIAVIIINAAVRRMREKYVTGDETVSSLLIFCKNNSRTVTTRFLQHFLKDQDPKDVAIAGGVVSDARPSAFAYNESVKCNILCIAFLQPKTEERNLLSYSLVLSVDPSFFQDALEQFKEKITLRSQSLAFRFSCSAKATSRREEVIAFNNVFPNTPIIGMDVYGEIGWDSNVLLSEVKEPEVKKTKKSELPVVFHEWTTTFLLITWDD